MILKPEHERLLADAVLNIWASPTFDGIRDRPMLREMCLTAGVSMEALNAAERRRMARLKQAQQ